MNHRALKHLFRFGFLALFLFECAGFLHITSFSPEFSWLGLLITAPAVLLLLEATDAWLRKRGSELSWMCWFVALLAVSLDGLGDLFHLYGAWHPYDKVAHAVGSAAVMIVALFVARAYARIARMKNGINVLTFFAYCVTITFGTFYEIEEFLEDYFTGSNRLGDGFDTGDDLLMNVIGALAIGVGFLIWHRFSKQDARR